MPALRRTLAMSDERATNDDPRHPSVWGIISGSWPCLSAWCGNSVSNNGEEAEHVAERSSDSFEENVVE
jgi:hypothetical protein